MRLCYEAKSCFGVGGLLLDVGATAIGVAIWRSRIWSRWRAVFLLLALPLDVAAFIWLNAIFLTATILALIVGYNLQWGNGRSAMPKPQLADGGQ